MIGQQGSIRSQKRLRCPECRRLSQQVTKAAHQIRHITQKRYKSLDQKLRDLREWQGVRDEATAMLQAHKASHRRAA